MATIESVSSSQAPDQAPDQASQPSQAPPLTDSMNLRRAYILPDGINDVSGVLAGISYVDDIDTLQPYKLYFNVTFDGELFRVKVNQSHRADGQQIVKFRCLTTHANAEFNAFLDRVLLGFLRNNGIMRLDGSALPSRYQPRLESSE